MRPGQDIDALAPSWLPRSTPSLGMGAMEVVIVHGRWSAAGPESCSLTLWGPLALSHCSGPPVLG